MTPMFHRSFCESKMDSVSIGRGLLGGENRRARFCCEVWERWVEVAVALLTHSALYRFFCTVSTDKQLSEKKLR